MLFRKCFSSPYHGPYLRKKNGDLTLLYQAMLPECTDCGSSNLETLPPSVGKGRGFRKFHAHFTLLKFCVRKLS